VRTLRGSLTAHPCAGSERAGLRARAPSGFFLRALTAAEGDPGGAKKRTSCPQKRTPRCAR